MTNQITMTAFGLRSLVMLSALILSLLPGCETTKSNPQAQRIAEHQAEFRQLSEDSRQQLSAGLITRGQSLKAVYMALGKPDLIITSPNGHVVNWTYSRYQPPKTAEQKKADLAEIQRRSNVADPLMDAMQAWRNNASRFGGAMEANLDSQFAGQSQTPVTAPRANGQSWEEYGKYLRNREFAGPAIRMVDRMQQEKYNESLYIDPAPDPVTVKLEIIFIEQLVSDAIIDDSQSAFVAVR